MFTPTRAPGLRCLQDWVEADHAVEEPTAGGCGRRLRRRSKGRGSDGRSQVTPRQDRRADLGK